LSRDTAFRRQARWSLERLGPGAATEERRLVERADHALVSWAGELARAMASAEARDVDDDAQESSRFFDPAAMRWNLIRSSKTAAEKAIA
jgi:hypothetical protein